MGRGAQTETSVVNVIQIQMYVEARHPQQNTCDEQTLWDVDTFSEIVSDLDASKNYPNDPKIEVIKAIQSNLDEDSARKFWHQCMGTPVNQYGDAFYRGFSPVIEYVTPEVALELLRHADALAGGLDFFALPQGFKIVHHPDTKRRNTLVYDPECYNQDPDAYALRFKTSGELEQKSEHTQYSGTEAWKNAWEQIFKNDLFSTRAERSQALDALERDLPSGCKNMNEEFSKVFHTTPPARTTIEARLAEPSMLVEIEAIAYVKLSE